jgi:integrase
MRRSLQVLFNTAREMGWEKDPLKGIGGRRAKAKLNKPYANTPALLNEIKAYNENLHLCCLLTYGCLLRPHREVRELTWGDFSDDLNYIRLSGERNKSGRNRIVPVPYYVKEVLKKNKDHLNIFSGSEHPFDPDYFKGLWSRFKKRSKLLEENQTLYSFRHTGAIDVYKRTSSIEKLKAAMGHSNIMVSLTYLRGLDVAELKEEDMPVL